VTHLEPDILRALAEAGLDARSAACISTIRSPEIDRVAYRVDAGDRIVKARRLENADVARELCVMRQELPDAFARVLSRHGRVLIEEWVEGEPLPHPPDPQYLAEAGALLSGMHARPTAGGRVVRGRHDTSVHRRSGVTAIGSVVAAGALTADEAAGLTITMERFDPGVAHHGLVHLDFTGENMVVDRHGRVRVVDNERIGVDALGFDLARTWYRWALPAPDWSRFALSYSAGLSHSEPIDDQRFWRIVAVARAAALRLRVCPDRAGAPLSCLRALAAESSS
jgi:hypothetical protein